jgi:uncharacterized repeat protein (TIGR01451 family)
MQKLTKILILFAAAAVIAPAIFTLHLNSAQAGGGCDEGFTVHAVNNRSGQVTDASSLNGVMEVPARAGDSYNIEVSVDSYGGPFAQYPHAFSGNDNTDLSTGTFTKYFGDSPAPAPRALDFQPVPPTNPPGSATLEATFSGLNMKDFIEFDAGCQEGTSGQPNIVDAVAQIIFVPDIAPDFLVSCSPLTQTITTGDSTSFNLTTTLKNGFDDFVTFSSSFSPSVSGGPATSFVNNGVKPNAVTTANITTSSSTPKNTYSITFTATGGGKTHSCTTQLSVNGPVVVSGTDNLAIYQQPVVTLLVNGKTTEEAVTGQYVNLTWNTIGTNSGNDCTSSGTGNWGWDQVHPASDPGDHNHSVYAGDTPGTFTYIITCNGALNTTTSSTVTLVVKYGEDFTLACSPPMEVVVAGGTPSDTSYNLTTTPHNGFTTQIYYHVDYVIGGGGNQPQISFDSDIAPVGSTTVALIHTTGRTDPGSYTINFAAVSGSYYAGIAHYCTVTLIVLPNVEGYPDNPVASADNTDCGGVTVNWTQENYTWAAATGFRVFRSSAWPWDDNNAVDISGLLPSGARSYRDNTALYSDNYYKVVSYFGIYGNYGSNVVLSNALPCNASLSERSDKDIVVVQGKINKTFTPEPCSGTSDVPTLPGNALFSVGDRVTFRINVCNTGPVPLTQMRLEDHLDKNLTDPADFTPSCVSSSGGRGGGIYYSPSDKIVHVPLCDMDAGSRNSPSVQSFTFSAKIIAPVSATVGLFRFQNIADIYSNEIYRTEVMTPPYLFTVGGDLPKRSETAPD